jgi:hypothetical protein
MDFLKAYLGNLLKLGLVVLGMVVLLKVLYPDSLSLLTGAGQVYTGLNWWPIIILAVLLALAWPRRKRGRRR